MSANYVARELGYRMTDGWEQGERTTREAFRPIETFAARFGEILADVRALGFERIDVWTAHLGPEWATEAHLAIAREGLAEHGLEVVSLAGGLGADAATFEAACRLARALGAPLLSGSTSLLASDRRHTLELLERYDLRLALENDDEPTPQALLARLGAGAGGRLGVTVDTGAFGAHGYDAARALEELAPHLLHIHLKDVLAEDGHPTCRYGLGLVPIEGCLAALARIGYTGAICVEHEPERFDPSEDCRAGREWIEAWGEPR